MITKDKRDLPLLEITPENYLVPKGEEHLYHIRMEVKSFDMHTGKRLSHPYLQKFNIINIKNGILSLLRQQGYTLDILHDPETWMAENAAKTKAKAEAQKAAELEALKEKLRAEIRAEEEAKAKAAKASEKKTKKSKQEDEDLS